jgi:hypothetical protein
MDEPLEVTTKKSELVEECFLSESTRADQFWYLDGVFAQSETPNKNRRVYPEKILDREMHRFNEELVMNDRGAGELCHPSYSNIDPYKVAIKIEKLEKQGTDWLGRAKVLNTPSGQILQALIEGGLRVGVSTRGDGTTTRHPKLSGHQLVNSDYKLFTIDAVINPSAPKAIVDAIYEEDARFENLMEDALLREEFIAFIEQRKSVKQIVNKPEREASMIQSVDSLLKSLLGK